MMIDPHLVELVRSIARRGRVRAADVEALHDALQQRTGAAITRAEAELLLGLQRAVRGGTNDPDWDDLFVGALAHHLLGASGHAVRSREAALTASCGLTPAELAPDAIAWVLDRLPHQGWQTEAERALRAFMTSESRAVAL